MELFITHRLVDGNIVGVSPENPFREEGLKRVSFALMDST
jgi:hypothetical protein